MTQENGFQTMKENGWRLGLGNSAGKGKPRLVAYEPLVDAGPDLAGALGGFVAWSCSSSRTLPVQTERPS
jgi:hypothetical protein